MSNNSNEIITEAKEIYDSIEKIQSALADGKITADEAGVMLQSLSTISTDLPELAQEGKDLIDAIENKVDQDMEHAQESKFYKACSTLWGEFSMANLINVFYAILEIALPSEPAPSTTVTEIHVEPANLVADQSETIGNEVVA
ncbi:MAG: hypothetical protein ACK5WS_04415 [Alphaproteobacteria bacterium]|jgi:hypothetical protein|nr:hypothetical protein [Candidatus Jidaibacter sp.]